MFNGVTVLLALLPTTAEDLFAVLCVIHGGATACDERVPLVGIRDNAPATATSLYAGAASRLEGSNEGPHDKHSARQLIGPDRSVQHVGGGQKRGRSDTARHPVRRSHWPPNRRSRAHPPPPRSRRPARVNTGRRPSPEATRSGVEAGACRNFLPDLNQ